MSSGLMEGGGTAFQAFSQLQSGNTNAYIAQQRAAIAGFQANSVMSQSGQAEAMYRTRADQYVGKQAAQIGASGVQLSGSTARTLEDTAGLAASDIARIRNNAALEAWGFRTSQAADQYNAGVSKAGGEFGAVSSLLNGAARSKGMWNNY